MTANDGDYRLDPSILAIDDIYMVSGTNNYRIQRLSTTDLLNRRLLTTASSPVQVYALNGIDLLMVYPAPTQADTLTIYYVPKPTALANPTDDPSSAALGGIPSEYHYGLELYMMWKAADATDDEGSQRGETYRRMYLGDPNTPPGTEQRDGFVGTMKKDVRRKGGKHLAGVTIPPRTRRVYQQNPGVDVGSLY
jgi:hypothetical protein